MDEYNLTRKKVSSIAVKLVIIAQSLEDAENVDYACVKRRGRYVFRNGANIAIRNYREVTDQAYEMLTLVGELEAHPLLTNSGITLNMLLSELKQDDVPAKWAAQDKNFEEAVAIIRRAFDRGYGLCGFTLKKLGASLRTAIDNDEFGRQTASLAVEKSVGVTIWHAPGEPPPDDFFSKELTGTKSELAECILPESSAKKERSRQLGEYLSKNSGWIWGRKNNRYS